MFKSVWKLCVLLTLLMGFATHAYASLVIGDDNYVGVFFPPEPADGASEVGYINNLTTVAAGSTSVIDTRTYNRVDGIAGPFDTAVYVLGESFKSDSGDNTITLTGTFQEL